MLMMMNKLEPSSAACFSSSYYSSLNLVTTATREAAEGASSPASRLPPPASSLPPPASRLPPPGKSPFVRIQTTNHRL